VNEKEEKSERRRHERDGGICKSQNGPEGVGGVWVLLFVGGRCLGGHESIVVGFRLVFS
jgi:hypothetical protein